MTGFITALSVFLLAHTLPAATGWRGKLIARFGKKRYILFYSIFSTALLIWLIWAALAAPYVELWQPGLATLLFPVIAMLLASILLTSAVLRPNPLSIAFINKPVLPGTGILTLIRHPLIWALFLWAASHAIANGDLVSLILFGGLALFSLAGKKILETRAKNNLSSEEFAQAMALTKGPVRARLIKALDWTTSIEIILGIVLYISILHAHEPVIGVDPLALILP
jgi:uncharacterized membrane protein